MARPTWKYLGKWAFRTKSFAVLCLILLVLQLLFFITFQVVDVIEEDVPSKNIRNNKVVAATSLHSTPAHTSSSKRDVSITCKLDGKEVTSALSRSKSTECSQLIVDTYCQLKNNTLFPSHLPRYCTAPGVGNVTHLGCYYDRKDDRDLNGHSISLETLTISKCINLCLSVGYQYAGVQYSKECMCGNTYGKHGRLEGTFTRGGCNSKCTGNSSEICGGHLVQNVYTTGLGAISRKYANVAAPITLPVSLDGGAGDTLPPVRVVFVLTITGRAVRQVHRLLRSIYHTYHYYYIHVDSRQEYLYRELLPLESKLPNIALARHRLPPIWGGASLLQTLLSCISHLLHDLTHWRWDILINLSESDFPLKSIEELTGYLTENRGMNFVKSHGKDTPRFIRKQGLDKTFVECDMHMWRIGEKRLPNNIRVDGGSDWVALSRDFCQYVATPPFDKLLTGLHQVWKFSLLPAESFFHTVLWNSGFCDTILDNNLHLTNWRRKQGCKCQYKHIVDWCGCSPNDFLPTDMARLKLTKSKPLYFARKFEAVINQEIIRQVEVDFLGIDYKGLDNYSINSFWLNEYHYLDKERTVTDYYHVYYEHFAVLSHRHISGLGCVSEGEGSIKVQQVYTYHYNDQPKGLILLYQTTNDERLFETLVEPRTVDWIKHGSRLREIEVGCEYDVKEEILRGAGGLLGPSSLPVARLVWLGLGPATSYMLVWTNPFGHVLHSSTDSLPEAYGTTLPDNHTHYSVQVKTPLMPGIWNLTLLVKVSDNEEYELAAYTSFLITPLYSTDDISRVNGATSVQSDVRYREIEHLLDYLHLSSPSYRHKQHKKLSQTWSYSGDFLINWISTLVSRFWQHNSTCWVKSNVTSAPPNCYLDECGASVWSTKSLDIKSHIGDVDATSGKLLPII